ncbi:hypothetical protein, partial [Novosphingobium resinovorum]|uniref:hypothetical protein n=1 Tax=Novosphingobium resinovorum TaxID=158500 RepID=UPI002ED6924D|nr:hypothetical protein [Novosphingobium resinovorum]
RACPPSDRPSLTEYQDLRQTNALIAVGAYQSRISNFCQSSARLVAGCAPDLNLQSQVIDFIESRNFRPIEISVRF